MIHVRYENAQTLLIATVQVHCHTIFIESLPVAPALKSSSLPRVQQNARIPAPNANFRSAVFPPFQHHHPNSNQNIRHAPCIFTRVLDMLTAAYFAHSLPPVMKPHNFPNDAVLLDLNPSPAKLPESLPVSSKCKSKKILPVRTEFVFTAHQPFSSVMLCGDWADWNPIPMTLEQRKSFFSHSTTITKPWGLFACIFFFHH